MGVEAFGLIGFFLMLQVWLQLLDLGLSPALSREMSLYRAGSIGSDQAWERIRSLEWLLGLVTVFAVTFLVIFRNWIAVEWLGLNQLSPYQLRLCIVAMAAAAATRLLAGLYRFGLIGMERQLWVNGIGVLFVTVRFVGVIPFLAYVSSAAITFFTFQAAVGFLELLVFAWKIYRSLPGYPVNAFPTCRALQSMFPIAGAMAFMGGIWIFLTQIDKLILSRVLTLESYGYFTLAVVVAGGLLSALAPLNQVLQPRMTILVSRQRKDELCQLYRLATQMITAGFITVGGTMAIFADAFLYAWTGNAETVQFAAPILFWYGLANALIGVLILPFLLQFAHGHLRLHVIGNVLLSITLLPALIYTARIYGGVGCGVSLLIARLLFLFLWVPLVHRRFLPDLVWSWIVNDFGKVAVPILIILMFIQWIIPPIENRVMLSGAIILSSSVALLAGLFVGSRSRRFLLDMVRRKA